jgi:hypothetical protein
MSNETDNKAARMLTCAEKIVALWMSWYVPHSGQDWARYHVHTQWPALYEALNDLADGAPEGH